MTSFLEKKKIVKFSFGQELGGGGGGGVAIDFISPTRTLNIFLQTLLNSANESLLSNCSTVYRVFIAKNPTSWHYCDTNIKVIKCVCFIQEWLISLAVIHPNTEEETKISDMVFSLFR